MNNYGDKKRIRTSVHVSLNVVLSATAMLLIGLAMVVPQRTSVGQERVSRPGELQTNPKAEQQPTGPKMAPAPSPEIMRLPHGRVAGPGTAHPERVVAVPINGKIERMEDQLEHRREAPSGQKQQGVVAALAEKPEIGRGEQKREVHEAERAAAVSHVRLVLQISDQGKSQVISATEIPGEAVLSDVPAGDFILAVSSGDQPVAVQAIPDPFELRSFSGPEGTPTQGHHITQAKTATVTVDIPKANLATNFGSFAVKFYKLRPGPLPEKIDPTVFRKLTQENRLQLRVEVPGQVLAPQVREKGRRLRMVE